MHSSRAKRRQPRRQDSWRFARLSMPRSASGAASDSRSRFKPAANAAIVNILQVRADRRQPSGDCECLPAQRTRRQGTAAAKQPLGVGQAGRLLDDEVRRRSARRGMSIVCHRDDQTAEGRHHVPWRIAFSCPAEVCSSFDRENTVFHHWQVLAGEPSSARRPGSSAWWRVRPRERRSQVMPFVFRRQRSSAWGMSPLRGAPGHDVATSAATLEGLGSGAAAQDLAAAGHRQNLASDLVGVGGCLSHQPGADSRLAGRPFSPRLPTQEKTPAPRRPTRCAQIAGLTAATPGHLVVAPAIVEALQVERAPIRVTPRRPSQLPDTADHAEPSLP